MKEVSLKSILAPSFYELHRDVKEERYVHYWLKGGRGSTKSSFAAIQIILGMMKHPDANAVALRKVGVNLKDSVYEQLQWAVQMLGVEEYWDSKLSPLELTYRPTGQRIIFRGADKPKKIKSTKFRRGYARYIWYEEVDEFHGPDEIRMINQSLMRGGEKYAVFYTYNPPQSQRNWVNAEVLDKRPDKLVHHSTYLTVPPHWLGEQFFIDANHLKATKPERYDHEYLGEVTGTGGEVFTNLTLRTISDQEIEAFDRIRRGLDFGYAADPLHYTVNHYDKTRRRLYIFYEIHKTQMKNSAAVAAVKRENKGNRPVVADSAEPRTINEFRELGLNIVAAKKGPDSVEHGIKFLQDLEEIVIDPERCPNTAREFNGYELERDSNGNFKADYPDKDNHSVDATRYSLESEMRSSRAKVSSKAALGVR